MKKITGTPSEYPKRLRFYCVDCLKHKYSIDNLCRYLGVSRQGYYKWIHSGKQMHIKYDPILAFLVKEIYFEHPKGYRYITMQLKRKHGIIVNSKTIYRYMQILGIKSAIRKRKYTWSTPSKILTDNIVVSPNVLQRNFKAEHPLEKLVTDVSYVYHRNGRMYLSIIKDLFDNSILSYAISRYNDYNLVLNNLNDVFNNYSLEKTILHSDQGSQYTCKRYIEVLKQHNITPSNSRKGNCLDNACAENFFSHLKSESLSLNVPNNENELIRQIHKYIEFYNNDRPQEKLKGMTPIEYRRSYLDS